MLEPESNQEEETPEESPEPRWESCGCQYPPPPPPAPPRSPPPSCKERKITALELVFTEMRFGWSSLLRREEERQLFQRWKLEEQGNVFSALKVMFTETFSLSVCVIANERCRDAEKRTLIMIFDLFFVFFLLLLTIINLTRQGSASTRYENQAALLEVTTLCFLQFLKWNSTTGAEWVM